MTINIFVNNDISKIYLSRYNILLKVLLLILQHAGTCYNFVFALEKSQYMGIYFYLRVSSRLITRKDI